MPNRNSLPLIKLSSKFDLSYCAMLVEHMKKGYSFHSFAAIAHVSPSTLNGWCRQHQAFAEAKEYGEAHALHYKEKIAFAITTGQMQGDLRGALFLLKTDRSRAYAENINMDVTHHLENLSDEQIEAEIRRLTSRAEVIDTEAIKSEG
jgi:hypothetical protein